MSAIKFHDLQKWLKPGGQLLTTGYTAGKGAFTDQFKAYLADRHYGLKNKDAYIDACQAAGYTHVAYEDLTPRFDEILRTELKHVEDKKDEFVALYSEERLHKLVDGWNDKQKYIAADNHNWTMIYCRK